MVRVDPTTGEGTSLVQLQARVHLWVHAPGRSVQEGGRDDFRILCNIPEERKRLDVEEGRQTGHHPKQAEPLRGSSHIPLPERILKRKAIINMENDDEECFKWAVTRALNPVEKNPQRVTKEPRKQSEELNWDEIEFPTPCLERMFKKFAKNNNVSLSVFGHEAVMNNTYIIPLYVLTERREKVVRLFFLKDLDWDGIVSHYCVIKDMSRLVGSQASTKKEKKYVCDFCLNMFGSQELLDEHTEYCSKHYAVNTVMPKPEMNTLKFKNIQNSVECPVKFTRTLRAFWNP